MNTKSFWRTRGATAVMVLALSGTLPACVSNAQKQDAYLEPPTGTTATPAGRSLVQITPMGAGKLTATTAYSSKAIKAAMPGFQVEAVPLTTESSTVNALSLFDGGWQVLQIAKSPDGTIGAIHGVTRYLTGPNGERIGMTLAETGVDPKDCRPGKGNWRGMVICTAHGTNNIELVFSIPNFEASDHLPPPRQMAAATLQRIVWQPEDAAASG